MKSTKTISHRLVEEPAVADHRKIRPSRNGKRRALVLGAVHVVIGLHIAHWLTSGTTVTPVEPSEAMAFSRDSIINAGLIFFAAMIGLTAIFGRFFCGWGCHLVALQDLCRHWLMKIGITPQPLRSRWLAWVPTLAFAYMFLWPAAFRLWTGDSLAVRGLELTTSDFWATFPGWIVGGLTLLTCGFACVYFLGAKGFCTYACPYGAVFAAADRLAPLRIRVSNACEQCGHCTAVCSSNIRVHEEVRDWGMVMSPGCMKCMDCVSVCPKDALSYSAGPIPLLAQRRTAVRQTSAPPLRGRDEALLVVVFAATFFCVRGIYGVVPFLLALGLAGISAFLALTALRLARQPTLSRPGLRLKQGGQWLPGGRVFLLAGALWLTLLLHCALIVGHDLLGAQAYERLLATRVTFLNTPDSEHALEARQQADAERATHHFLAIEQHGLLAWPGNSARLAWLHWLQGDTNAALARSQLAIERAELAGQMHQLRAQIMSARGEAAAAISEWQLAIHAQPESADAYLALGLYHANAGDLDSARQVFESGVAALPQSVELRYNAGLARAMSGDVAGARAAFERALELDPRHLPSRENLAGLLASQGDFAASVGQFRIAAEQSPDDAGTRLMLARALLGMGDRDAAAKALAEALRLAPDDPEALALSAELAGE